MRGTTIAGVTARRVWTVDGSPALEVEVYLQSGAQGRGTAAPAAGWSRGTHGLRGDQTPLHSAVEAINQTCARLLHGIDATRQEDVDAVLRTLEIGNDRWTTRAARSACSIAAALSAARGMGIPLFRHLRASLPLRMPMPVIDIASATAAASPFRALAVVPFAAAGIEDALAIAIGIRRVLNDYLDQPTVVDELTIQSALRAIEQAGFVPGEEIGIALDVGAPRIYRDRAYVALDGTYDAAHWQNRLVRAVETYSLCAITDPVADRAALPSFAPVVDHRARVVGDELLAIESDELADAIAHTPAAAAALRPEAAGTLTDLQSAYDAAHRAGWPVLAAATAGEDGNLAHIATAWQASYIKLGAVGQGGVASANELLRIEAGLLPAQSALRIEAAARLVY